MKQPHWNRKPEEDPEPEPYTFRDVLREPRRQKAPWYVWTMIAIMLAWWAFEFGRALGVW